MAGFALTLLVSIFALGSACPYGKPCVAHFRLRTWSPSGTKDTSASVCSYTCGQAGYDNYCHNPYGQSICYCHEGYGQCGCGSASYNGLPSSCGYNAVDFTENEKLATAAAAAAKENLGTLLSAKAESDIVSMAAAPNAEYTQASAVEASRSPPSAFDQLIQAMAGAHSVAAEQSTVSAPSQDEGISLVSSDCCAAVAAAKGGPMTDPAEIAKCNGVDEAGIKSCAGHPVKHFLDWIVFIGLLLGMVFCVVAGSRATKTEAGRVAPTNSMASTSNNRF